MADFQLFGRLFIYGEIVVKTGLHIGGSGGTFSIGGVDNPVITDAVTGEPYIPGSSLRGKMRSLTEKYRGDVKGQRISQIEIHACSTESAYQGCPICNIYGVSATSFNLPTRLVVRDLALTPESSERLNIAKTALPFIEVKTEVSIDRVTSQATPRDIARVPAGAIFGPLELVYSIYTPQDVTWLDVVVDGMELLQDDYLGGSGSRGSGKVEFANLQVVLKRSVEYRNPWNSEIYPNLVAMSAGLNEMRNSMRDYFFGGA